MPFVRNPDGTVSNKPMLDPTDILASGAKSATELAGGDAPAAPPVPQVNNPGFAPDDPRTGSAPLFRNVTQPRWITPVIRQRNTTRG